MILRTLAIGTWLFALGSFELAAQNLAPSVSLASEAELQDLGRSLQIRTLIGRMRQEGLDAAPALANDFGIQRPTALLEQFERLYDAAAMEGLILAELQRALQDDPDVRAQTIRFFSSPLGEKVLSAEIAARSAIEDPDTKAAAKVRYDLMAKDDPARRGLIDGMIKNGDLVEFNVMGGLNSNLAMLRGMVQTGALGDLPESEMLALVWGDEQEIRDSTADWLTLLMSHAYQDLSLDELQAYSDFITSPEGKRLNAALFAGFDTMYRGLSEQQGRIVGQLMQGEDI